MKKNFTLLLAFFITASLSLTAQSNRVVMVEEATQASCGPCAGQNPAFDALLDANTDKVVVLKYQTSWPGFDQMNLDNPGEVQDRVDYYGISGVPNGFVNGVGITNDCNAYDWAPACLSQDEIDAAYDEMSAFDMTLEASVLDDMMTITGSVTATGDASGDLRLRIAITEKTINYEDVPGGTNGETKYHHVLKKFVGGSAGIALENTWAAGDTYDINETFNLTDLTIYTMGELEVVAFVQDDNNKAIHQAVKDDQVALESSYDVGSALLDVTNVSESFCSGTQTFSPVVELQNKGNDNLTSALITYSANGGTAQTYEWTGNLPIFEKTEVTLNPISFTTVPTVPGYLDVNVSEPNGMADENAADDDVSAALRNAVTTNTIELSIRTDFWGYETYWAVLNPIGGIVAEGGNLNIGLDGGGLNQGTENDPGAYASESLYEETVEIPADGCYRLVVVDSYGDGIVGGGYVFVRNSENDIIINLPTTFGDSGEASFSNAVISDITTPEAVSEFSINPNPVTDVAMVNFSMAKNAKTTISVVDALGKEVLAESFGTLASGTHTRELQMNSLANGVYFVRLNAGNTVVTKKITLVK